MKRNGYPRRTVVQDRFDILLRDSFTCQFCGKVAANSDLQVDHLLPWARGGSDDPSNLVTACKPCNQGKLDRVIVPAKMCEGSVDPWGWITWRRWGDWHIQFLPEIPEKDPDDFTTDGEACCALTYQPEDRNYWIDITRVHETHTEGGGVMWGWEIHFERKAWLKASLFDLYEALAFARRIVRRDEE